MKQFTCILFALLLSACAADGSNPFNPNPTGKPVVDTLTTVHNITSGLVASAEDFELSGDLSHDDVVWIKENFPKIDAPISVALKIAKGELNGDIVGQLDLSLLALDNAIQLAPSDSARQFFIRTRAAVKFYRAAVINAGAS